ncbi:MAG: hypothetical protein NTZ39_06410 [Methanoregula sp.]|nr:hypothetical protein [Methanoregula sp.]
MPRNYFVLLAFVLIACCSVLIFPVLATTTSSQTSGDDALTRGNGFTITITGKPNTPYYVWLTRTWSLSGKPGDQPPVIVSYQSNVEKDPPEGPYIIGTYAYNNGNGRTILDDVAPSSLTQSNTSYYAQVTTDSYGEAVVGFRTSVNTAIQTFSIRVENPQSPTDDTMLVQRGDQTVRRGSVSIGFDTTVTLPRTPLPTPVPTLTTPLPEITIPLPLPTTSPTATQTQKMPLELVLSVVALGFGILTVRKR